jgi:hypothetical protein
LIGSKTKEVIMNTIPGYVSDWTDKYFHQSAFDKPLEYPNKKVLAFLAQFKKLKKLKLYRGINYYNKDNKIITSWTYSKTVARRFAKELKGHVVSKEFSPASIMLDTTVLSAEQKKYLGYDFKNNDKEVIIMDKKIFPGSRKRSY